MPPTDMHMDFHRAEFQVPDFTWRVFLRGINGKLQEGCLIAADVISQDHESMLIVAEVLKVAVSTVAVVVW
jgi:hypothetical protein